MGGAATLGERMLSGVKLPERYEVRRRIADGGMASVWCAFDRALGRSVALKLLGDPLAHDPGAVRRFQREARTAARLSGHPHVVTIYDVGQAEDDEEPRGRPFIVMEYLPAGTVADAMRVRAVTPAAAIRWIHEAASALDHAHAHGVIHRDIKPANFLLDADRVLHVADFGIAQLGGEDAVTTSGEMLGTAAYIDPERALGLPATAASDRYALAVVAFELLVGERPFAGGNFAIQARAHVEQEPPAASLRNPTLPPAIDAVLARGMAKRPEDRWWTAGEFARALEATLTPSPAQASARTAAAGRRAPGPAAARRGAAIARPGRSRRGLALAALTAGALGIAIAAVASQEANPPASSAGGLASSAHSTTQHRHHYATTRSARVGHARSAKTSTTRTVPASPAAATTPPPTADTLEARGHALMVAGSYAAAIPLLREAVAAAAPASITYAYALFDLGRSLRLAGDPRAAVPILWRRLQIPNQTEVVREELQLALEALGKQASPHNAPSGQATPPPHHSPPPSGGGGMQPAQND